MTFLSHVFTYDWVIELVEHVPVLTVRTLVTFLTVLIVVRWTGKRSIANLAPFDMAMVIMIGEVAAIPVSELRVDLLHGILPVVLIGGMHVLMTTVSLYSKTFERLTEGKPTLLVKDGQVLTKNLAKERVSMSDLLTALRHKEVTDVSQVREAWIEHAGGVSVIRKETADRVTPPNLEAALGQAIDQIVARGTDQMRRELTEMLRRFPEVVPPPALLPPSARPQPPIAWGKADPGETAWENPIERQKPSANPVWVNPIARSDKPDAGDPAARDRPPRWKPPGE